MSGRKREGKALGYERVLVPGQSRTEPSTASSFSLHCYQMSDFALNFHKQSP